jgi:hypothetical protein
MAKDKNPVTGKAQTQGVAREVEATEKVQEKTPPVKKIALNLHKKRNSIRNKPKKKK